MKILLIVGLVVAAALQANARAITHQDLPQVLKDNMEQAFSCALQLGPEASNLPKIQTVLVLPEDNPSLNKLWACVWEKKGIIDQQGEVYPEKIRQYLVALFSMVPSNIDVENVADAITEVCKDVEGSDYTEKSIKIQNCITRESFKY